MLFKKLLLFAGAVFGLILLYLLFFPVSISPAAWQPSPAPALTAQYMVNSRLLSVERLGLGDGFAPEDVALDKQGRLYAGFADGRLIQLQPDGGNPRVFANTYGRPLGLVFDGGGNLIVADALKGLLSVDPAGQVKTLTTEADGLRFGCTNDVDIAADGTIYFTDASSKYPLTQFTADLLEHQPNGRLLAYDPKTQQTHTLLANMYFANGVAISPDQSFLLVVETGLYRVRRLWLSGEKEGQSESFIDNLPGFPDGISSNGKGKFWLALVTPRDAVFDRVLPHPFLRKIIFRLPKALQPAPKRYSFVLGLDSTGNVTDNLQDGSTTCYAEIANAVERDGKLYFGSIGESTIGRFSLW
ncbi:MAG: SMP-30/gluconolactonase/LRE family protein [Pyrinomonadaceae bacterium]